LVSIARSQEFGLVEATECLSIIQTDTQSFTTQECGKGTGLGLSIVQRLVSRSKGAIKVRTKVGQGTKFTIYLPLA